MTSLNNLKGHIVKDGNIVYDEILPNKLHFSVVLQSMEKEIGQDWASSAQICIYGCINDGTIHEWSNGVKSLNGESYIETVELNETFKELQETITKDNFKVYQVSLSERVVNNKKQRTVKWIVEAPKDKLLEIMS
jgi:hypothetical protein